MTLLTHLLVPCPALTPPYPWLVRVVGLWTGPERVAGSRTGSCERHAPASVASTHAPSRTPTQVPTQVPLLLVLWEVAGHGEPGGGEDRGGGLGSLGEGGARVFVPRVSCRLEARLFTVLQN